MLKCAGVVGGAVGLAPTFRVANIFLHWGSHDPAIDDTYPTDVVKAAFIALIGITTAYLLIRIGMRLQAEK
jgi:hypothetical protein